MVFLSIRVPQFACKRFRLTIYSLFPTSGWHNRSRGHMACDKDFGGLPVGNWRGEQRLAFVQSYTKVNTHHPRVLFPLAGILVVPYFRAFISLRVCNRNSFISDRRYCGGYETRGQNKNPRIYLVLHETTSPTSRRSVSDYHNQKICFFFFYFFILEFLYLLIAKICTYIKTNCFNPLTSWNN